MFKLYLNIFLILFFSLSLFISCSKESDELSSDEIPNDPCYGIVCENDGVCIEGKCECKTGYIGMLCDSQNTPTIIILDSVNLLKYPATNNGIPWDSANGPDLSLHLIRDWIEVYNFGGHSDADSNSIYVFKTNPPLEIGDIYYELIFVLEDFEFHNGGHESMASLKFNIYNDTNNFPIKMPLTDGEDFSLELYLRYSWD